MKVLFITEKLPYPLDTGGKIRTYHMLMGLSKNHDVTLLTTFSDKSLEKYLPDLKKICSNVIAVYVPLENKLILLVKIIKSFFCKVPIVVSRHCKKAVSTELKWLIKNRDQQFDVIHFDHLDATIYLKCLSNVRIPFILDEHNIVSNQVSTSISSEFFIVKKLYMLTQLKKTKRYESLICSKMAQCLVCSNQDKKYLQEISPNANISIIPNGVSLDYFTAFANEKKVVPKQYDMIFVGTLDYGPGITAVNFFCNDILPLIHQKKPELNVAFVGQNPPPFLLKLAATDNRVIITGRVKDIRPFVLKSRVFIVPLKSGSGTRLKILDAMAMGIPIVSTNIGAEGLDVDNEKHLLLADTPHSFCDCIFKLLDDPNLSKSLVTGALTCLQEKYCWEIIWTKLTHVYDELKLSGTGY